MANAWHHGACDSFHWSNSSGTNIHIADSNVTYQLAATNLPFSSEGGRHRSRSVVFGFVLVFLYCLHILIHSIFFDSLRKNYCFGFKWVSVNPTHRLVFQIVQIALYTYFSHVFVEACQISKFILCSFLCASVWHRSSIVARYVQVPFDWAYVKINWKNIQLARDVFAYRTDSVGHFCKNTCQSQGSYSIASHLQVTSWLENCMKPERVI